MKLAIIAKTSRMPHSRQSMTADGTPIFRYSPMSFMVSRSKKKKLSLRSVIVEQKSVIITKLKVIETIEASPKPSTSSLAMVTNRKHQKICRSEVVTMHKVTIEDRCMELRNCLVASNWEWKSIAGMKK